MGTDGEIRSGPGHGPGGRFRTLLARLTGGARGVPVPVTLYTRAVCPLCDEAKVELARVRTRVPWTLTVVPIDDDPGLEASYGRSVPVVAIAGRPAFKGRLTAAEFARKLARRAGEAR